MFDELDDFEIIVKIKVVGIGGGGISAVNKMIESKLNSPPFEFIAVDSNKKALSNSQAAQKILIGKNIEDSRADFEKIFAGAHVVFIVAGIGGKTGTSAAPFIAEIAKKSNAALTVAVVSTPFSFENTKRSVNLGMKKLRRAVNTLIEVPNEATIFLAGKQGMLLSDSIKIVDDVMCKAVQNVAYVLTNDGRTAMDFGDLCTVFKNGGFAMIGIGEASGENAPVQAAKAAINSPFLYDSLENAHRVFVNITTVSKNVLLESYVEAINLIDENIIDDADFFWGVPVDENLGDTVRVTIIAMCFDGKAEIIYEPIISQNQNLNNGSIDIPSWMK